MGFKDDTEGLGKSWFRNFAAQLWANIIPNLPPIISNIFAEIQKATPSPVDVNWTNWVDKLVFDKIIPADTAKLLKGIADDPFPLGFLEMLMTRIKIFSTEIESITNIYGLDRQYLAMEKTTPNPAPVAALIQSMILDPKRTTENRQQLKKHGFNNTQIDNLILSYYKTVDEGTVRMLYLRGEYTGEQLYERMFELGYTKTRVDEIVKTWQLIPGPGDLLNMVAKEAFEPVFVSKIGLDAEFPSEQSEWFEKQGISLFWQHKFWQAHWAQPSLGQGFEMLHRGKITTAELDLLFKAVEIPPFWRDKLPQIAYNPYTRVDARRMADFGVLKTEDLLTAYTDIGYDATKAAKMVEFTLKFNAGPQKELTRGAILDSYESGLINNATAKSLLTAQDYSSDLADYYLTLSDYKEAQQTQNLLIDNIKTRFLLNKITSSNATTDLSRMGMDSNRISALLANWSLEAYQYELLPSKTELTNFLLKGIITEAQYRGTMSQHGYDATSINWYLTEIKTETSLAARRPSKAELGRFLKSAIIQDSEYVIEMTALGYSQKYIAMYIADLL